MVKQINTREFYELVNGDKPVVCDFFATWCGPCRMLAPVMEELSEELGERAVFVKMDTDAEPEPAVQLRIYSIPCVKVFKGGEEVASTVGFSPKEEMKSFLEENV